MVGHNIELIIWMCMPVHLWLLAQVFLFSSFRIPSDSMSPALQKGDCVLVWKPIVGARLFNLHRSLQLEQTEIYRLPGFRKIRRNDVVVFNFPHPNDWSRMEMHIMKYYIKRCIGLPGDTVSIKRYVQGERCGCAFREYCLTEAYRINAP